MAANLSGNVRHAIHVLAQKYRRHEWKKRLKAHFENYCRPLNIHPSWKDYENAYAQTLCYPQEYVAFQFYKKTPEQRDTYLTMRRQDKIVQEIGDDPREVSVPGNKILFNILFKEFLAREWLNPTACTAEEFVDFVKRHGTVMLKPSDASCGHGIRLYTYEDDASARACHAELAGSGMLVEEMPAQHEQMNLLNPHCLNTVRISTYTDCDDVHILLATGRTSKGESHMDNFAAGGICFAIDRETGRVPCDGSDEDFHPFANHPLTGTAFKGFQIPNWDVALDVVRRAARKAYTLPQCRWLGWDVAFLQNGEVAIIECNWRQGSMAQTTHEKGVYHELVELVRKKR